MDEHEAQNTTGIEESTPVELGAECESAPKRFGASWCIIICKKSGVHLDGPLLPTIFWSHVHASSCPGLAVQNLFFPKI